MTAVVADLVCRDGTEFSMSLDSKGTSRVNLEMRNKTFLTGQVLFFPYPAVSSALTPNPGLCFIINMTETYSRSSF